MNSINNGKRSGAKAQKAITLDIFDHKGFPTYTRFMKTLKNVADNPKAEDFDTLQTSLRVCKAFMNFYNTNHWIVTKRKPEDPFFSMDRYDKISRMYFKLFLIVEDDKRNKTK